MKFVVRHMTVMTTGEAILSTKKPRKINKNNNLTFTLKPDRMDYNMKWTYVPVVLPRPKRKPKKKQTKLLNIDQNAKTVKGQKQFYMTGILYLAPAKLSGYEVCPMATDGCRAACLNTSGRAVFKSVQEARVKKTRFFFERRVAFMKKLCREIDDLIIKAVRNDMLPCVRLNGTSDIVWENVRDWNEEKKNLMEMYPGLNFYDYTKRYNRKNLPDNYHLTFSLAENNDMMAVRALENNINVATVFRSSHPTEFLNKPVVDGDENDLRFLDPKGVIVGLKAKGRARKDTSGFVRD